MIRLLESDARSILPLLRRFGHERVIAIIEQQLPAARPCPICGRPMSDNRGRPRKTCGAACRAKAYRCLKKIRENFGRQREQ